MPAQYSAERSVLLKILLHAAAHPSQSVNGVLLGKIVSSAQNQKANTEQLESPRSVTQQPVVEILDALPLFHTYLSLAPMAEVALVQANAYARSQGWKVVGYYHANERMDDSELGPVARKYADRIQSHTAEACVLLVDNSKLAEYLHQKAPSFLQLFAREGQKGWAPAGQDSLAADAGTVPKLFLDYFGEGRHRELVDFGDHLDDVRRDWLNGGLLS